MLRSINPTLTDGLSHAYCEKIPYNAVKISCTKQWHKVSSEGSYSDVGGHKWYNHKFYHFNGVRLVSISAGHNSNCPECLIIYGKRLSSKAHKTFEAIEKARGKSIPLEKENAILKQSCIIQFNANVKLLNEAKELYKVLDFYAGPDCDETGRSIVKDGVFARKIREEIINGKA